LKNKRIVNKPLLPGQYLLLLFGLCANVVVFAQEVDDNQVLPPESLEAIEDFFQNTETEGEFDFNTIFEQLESYLERPLNLNRAEEADLRNLGLLTDVQVLNLLQHRQRTGNLLAIYELQAIPGFDENTIQRILPFVSVNTGLDDFQLGVGEMLREGRNEVFLRWNRILETQRGYLPAEDPEANRYLGTPDQYYVRYKHSYYNRMSYGVTMEKDRGEEFFTGSNPNGFDYYSAHFFLKDYRSWLKALAVGDFQVSFGQGVIQFSGFGYGKSAQATTIKRTGNTIRPYSSVNEALFMRGAAVELAPTPYLDLALFASSRRRDGNLISTIDSLGNESFEAAISSFNDFGLHRTPAEIEDEGAIGQRTVGGSLRLYKNANHIALNVLYDQLDKPLNVRPRPYNRFFFNGDRLLNVSLDYSYLYKNFNLFGETAMSDNGGWATTNGLLIALHRRADLAFLYRNFQRDYQALNANPLAEATRASNEEGFYVGLILRPASRWEFSAYFDQFRFPWLRFQVDSPSGGYEYRARLTYEQRRRLRVYLEVRNESKDINAPDNETAFNFAVRRTLFQTRLHIGNQLSKSLELRSRFDWGYVEDEIEGRRQGFVILQDVIFRPADFPLSFTARYALFDTHGFTIRFYHFENNLLNTFLVPAYFNRGSRAYLNLRYRPTRNLTLEARIAQTFWSDREVVGSGLEQVTGPVRTEAGAQIKYRF
jgi:hypothetical protein